VRNFLATETNRIHGEIIQIRDLRPCLPVPMAPTNMLMNSPVSLS
jgi:hypothetical protein